MTSDYYATLGVSKTASQDEIKKSFRKLAMENHPDRHTGDKQKAEKFKKISEAYQVLGDPKARENYDRYGNAEGPSAGTSGFEGFGGFADSGFGFDIDMEDMFFGNLRKSKKHTSGAGSDLQCSVQITLEEAYHGKPSCNVYYNSMGKCKHCDATGGAGGAKPIKCSKCGGSGKVRYQKGFFTIEQGCGSCSGMGEMLHDTCNKCGGEGRIQKNKQLSVNIPQGIDENTKLRLSGEGDAGFRGGRSGDLYISVKIAKHDFFERRGSDLYCKIPIKMTNAILGCTLDIPHLDGNKYQIKIPEGTQSGYMNRLSNKGMSLMNSSRKGDLITEITVNTPQKLNKRQKELMKQFAEEEGEESYDSKLDSFFQKIKVKNLWKK